jgi:hypothetical protein
MNVNPVGCDKDLDSAMSQNPVDTRGYAERINLERLEMTVNIQDSALSISESLNSLKETPLVMHRIVFRLTKKMQWYSIMKEARSAYSKNWRCQPRVKRKLERNYIADPVTVWFEVPDPTFGTWCSIKLAVEVISSPAK